MKHNPMATANAAAGTTVVVFLVCRLLVGLSPEGMFTVAQSWFHGIALTQLNTWDISFGAFVLGLISSTVFAWLVGYLFAWFYNMSVKK